MINHKHIVTSDSIKPIFDILQGPVHMAVLKSAIEMKITDILEKHSGVSDIVLALGIGTEPANLCYFLDSMVSIGFAEKKDGEYFNTEFSRNFLCRNSKSYMGELVNNMVKMQHMNLNCIAESVKNFSSCGKRRHADK